jgi:hypothetical protein
MKKAIIYYVVWAEFTLYPGRKMYLLPGLENFTYHKPGAAHFPDKDRAFEQSALLKAVFNVESGIEESSFQTEENTVDYEQGKKRIV